MINRRLLLLSALALLVAFPAAAASYQEALLRQLRGLGFAKISVEHTLLGRTRFVARRADGTREIIINPRTGEVLRDLWIAADGTAGGGGLLDNSGSDDDGDNSGSGGSGGGDDDDDGGDDGDDD